MRVRFFFPRGWVRGGREPAPEPLRGGMRLVAMDGREEPGYRVTGEGGRVVCRLELGKGGRNSGATAQTEIPRKRAGADRRGFVWTKSLTS